MDTKFAIAYISPNGSTRTVAETQAHGLAVGGAPVSTANLSKPAENRALLAQVGTDGEHCLLNGSHFRRQGKQTCRS